MKRVRTNQRGFGLLTVMIGLVIISAVGIISILVIQRIQSAHKNKTPQHSANDSSGDTSTDKTDTSTLTTTYQSTVGGFKIKIPKSWTIVGYKNDQQVATLDGTETRIHLQVAPSTAKINNFGGDIVISDNAPGDAAWPLYPNGTILEKLRNNIEVWRDNQSQTLKQGITENMCPSVRIASNGAFGYQLKNGKYVSFIGSFCWAPGMSTSYSYGQQIISDEFNQTITMLDSLVQN